jgi:hypothetical protein
LLYAGAELRAQQAVPAEVRVLAEAQVQPGLRVLAEVRVLAEAQVQPGLRVQLMVPEKSAPVVARVLAAAQEH